MFSFLFTACHREDLSKTAPEPSKGKNENEKSGSPYDLITIQNGLLKFQNEMHYKQVLDQLEADYEAWNDKFEQEWASLDADALDDKTVALGFDEDKPLKDFEARFQLNSLRKRIEAEEAAWLNQSELNPTTDPEDRYTVDDEFEQTISNNTQEWMIGNQIYKGVGADKLYIIKDGSFTKLQQIRDGQVLAATDTSIVEYQWTAPWASVCRSWARSVDWHDYEPNKRRYKMITTQKYYYGTGSYSRGKMKHYKKINGKWKKRRGSLKVIVYGTVRSSDCSISSPLESDLKSKKRRRLSVREYHSGVLVRIQNRDVYSNHSADGFTATNYIHF
jgi:hypothetical protein